MGTTRKTKSVKRLLDTFGQVENALSVVELVRRLESNMNRTTVYRILKRLEDRGRLHSFVGKDGLRWYAKCQSCPSSHHTGLHPHFQCRDCGKTECLPITVPIPEVEEHSIDSVSLLLVGRCSNCMD